MVRMPSYENYFWREGRMPLVFWGWPLIYVTGAGIIWSSLRKERVKFPLLVIVIYTLVLMVYFANARFRAPLLPFLYLFAAYTLVSLTERFRRQ